MKQPKVKFYTLKSSGAQVFIHLCEICGKDASFGFDVALRKNRLGKWYCRDHREIGIKSRDVLSRFPTE